jgi:hypothetical protein
MSLPSHLPKIAALTLMGLSALFFSSCQSVVGPKADDYDAVAYRPQNPANVRVKVSLDKQMVYVMEGNRPLLVTATCVGTQAKPTPKGNFRVYKKIEEKRSMSYGFSVKGDVITPVKATNMRGGRYVGYPMAYWVEFSPAYGFHEGYVWNVPRSHGCLRLHRNVAPKFFALTRMGTPVNIANTQPEDATIGAKATRPGAEHYLAPDPPNSVLISSAVFKKPTKPLFAE